MNASDVLEQALGEARARGWTTEAELQAVEAYATAARPGGSFHQLATAALSALRQLRVVTAPACMGRDARMEGLYGYRVPNHDPADPGAFGPWLTAQEALERGTEVCGETPTVVRWELDGDAWGWRDVVKLPSAAADLELAAERTYTQVEALQSYLLHVLVGFAMPQHTAELLRALGECTMLYRRSTGGGMPSTGGGIPAWGAAAEA